MSCMASRVSHSDPIFRAGSVADFVMEAVMHASMIVNLKYEQCI